VPVPANADEKQNLPKLMSFSAHLNGCPIASLMGHRSTRWRMDMNDFQRSVAVLRGEALGARVIASLALQTILSMPVNRKQLLAELDRFVDETLNLGGPDKGDANDEPNTLMRETARFQIMQELDAMKRMFDDPRSE
jgi:hypothetical protein